MQCQINFVKLPNGTCTTRRVQENWRRRRGVVVLQDGRSHWASDESDAAAAVPPVGGTRKMRPIMPSKNVQALVNTAATAACCLPCRKFDQCAHCCWIEGCSSQVLIVIKGYFTVSPKGGHLGGHEAVDGDWASRRKEEDGSTQTP